MRRIGLGSQILIGMVVGSIVGGILGDAASMVQPVGDLFIRLLVLVAVPLVFFNLLAGLTVLSDVKTFGRLAGKTMTYYVTTDVAAILLGLGAMALLRPGLGMQFTSFVDGPVGTVPSIAEVLLGMIPQNAFEAFVEGNVVQIVVIAVLVGIATLLLGDESRLRLTGLYQDVSSLLRKLVDFILLTAPVGIGALMAVTVGTYGAALLGPMTRFLVGVYAAQLAVFVAYMVLLRFGSAR